MSDQVDQKLNHAKLVEKIRSTLASFFSSHIVTLFEKADDFLFEAANSAISTAEQNRMFEFMSALRVDKESIEKNFTTELRAYLKPISQQKEFPQKKLRKDDQEGGLELSLVAQDEMDELVTLSTISGKAAMDMQEAISHLEARLEHLGMRNLSIFHREALKPVHICDAFQDALEGTGYDRQDKLLLYKMFGEEVIAPLKELYNDLNNLLIEQGVLPKIEYRSQTSHNRSDFSADSYDEPVGDSYEETDAGDYVGGSAGRGGSAGGARASGGAVGNTGGAGASGPVSNVGGAGASGPVGNVGGAGASAASAGEGQPSGSGDQRISAGHPAGQVQQAVHNFLGGDPSQIDEGGTSSGGAGGGTYYT
ncbi:MAG: DUF1631 domain-containing protein, partial [Gammaproteobacteria bacterium]|nr:DUF1631 domain-containing protein [Gammaproteobacteria bacterium]